MTGAWTSIRRWPRAQWRVAGTATVLAAFAIGEVGQTLPWTSGGRLVKVEWWNYVTLILSAGLIGLIAGTFTTPGQARRSRVGGAAGTGLAGSTAAVVMACPVCSPIALFLFGSGAVLSFLVPYRAAIAFVSLGVLAVTLVLRLRTAALCRARSDGS